MREGGREREGVEGGRGREGGRDGGREGGREGGRMWREGGRIQSVVNDSVTMTSFSTSICMHMHWVYITC